MTNNSEDIRNSNGSLICNVDFDDGLWTIAVKKKDVYTFIKLYKNGDMSVENYSANNRLKELEYSVVIP